MSNELSNPVVLKDFQKVVEFIKEMDDLWMSLYML